MKIKNFINLSNIKSIYTFSYKYYKMALIFMNSKNSKTFRPQRLLIPINKIDLWKKKNELYYQIVVSNIRRKIEKGHLKTIHWKISAPTWNEKTKLPDQSYQLSKMILSISLKNMTHWLMNHHKYNKIQNKITFKIKTECHLELLTHLEALKIK